MPFKLSLNSSVTVTIETEYILSSFFNCCVFKWNLSCFHWVTLDLCYQNYIPAALLKLHHKIRLHLFFERLLFIFKLRADNISKHFCKILFEWIPSLRKVKMWIGLNFNGRPSFSSKNKGVWFPHCIPQFQGSDNYRNICLQSRTPKWITVGGSFIWSLGSSTLHLSNWSLPYI